MGMLEFGLGETFVIVDCTIANKLNLWNTRDSLEIRMKDRLFGFASLVIAVAVAF
jgi:hypothetical protein